MDDLKLAIEISADPVKAVKGVMDTQAAVGKLSESLEQAKTEAGSLSKTHEEAAKAESELAQKLEQTRHGLDALRGAIAAPRAIKDEIKSMAAALSEADKETAKLAKELEQLLADAAKPGLAEEEVKQLAATFDYLFAEMEQGKGKAEALRYELALAGKALESSEAEATVAKEAHANLNAELKADAQAAKELAKATAEAERNMRTGQAVVDRLAESVAKETASLERNKQALLDAGIDAGNLEAEYGRLTQAQQKAAESAARLDSGLRKGGETAAIRKNLTQILEGEAAAMAQAGHASQQAAKDTAEAGRQANQTKGHFNQLRQAAAGMLAGFSVQAFYGKLKSLTVELQSVSAQLKGMTKDGEDFANLQRKMSEVAAEHHKTLTDLSDAEKRLLAIEDAGIITRQENIALLEGMSNAQAKYGASSDQLKQVLYGLGQALASPVVHAEELNQVVEPLLGLMAKLDKASGQAAGGFRALVNEGRITNEMFKNVLLVALRDYEGAATSMGDTLQAKLSDYERAMQELAKAAEPEVGRFVSQWSEGISIWAGLLDRANRKIAGFYAAWKHSRGELTDDEADKEFLEVQKRIHDQYGKNTKAVTAHAAAINVDIDSITGLHSAERITAQVLDGLRQKWTDAQAAVEAKTRALEQGKATQKDVDDATQAAKKALADYNLELGKATEQHEQAAKSAATYSAQIQASASVQQAALKSQIDSIGLAIQEAQAAGDKAKVLELEAKAVEKAGEAKRAEIQTARYLVAAKTNEANAASDYADEVERTANALNGVNPKEQLEIDTARAAAAEKRAQADAERQHLAELTRLPIAFEKYKFAMTSSNAELRNAYVVAKAAWEESQRLDKAQKDGAVSAERAAVAQDAAAVALAKLEQAAKQAAKEEKYLADVQRYTSENVGKEVMQHNAAVAAQRRQNAAEAQAQAQARQQAASAEIHDGEQLQIMYASMAQEFNRFGETGAAALKAIEDGLGLGKYQWDVWTHAASTWIEQADKQAESVDRLTGNLQKATQTGHGLGDAIAAASKHFDKMDANHLEKLNAALDAARAKVRDLEDAIAGRLNSLADELDRKLGNEQAIERRRWQEQQKQIQEDIDVAKGLGSKDALAKAKEEQRIAKQIHDLNMKEAQARQQEAQQAKAQAPAAPSQAAPPQHAGTVNFDAIVNGQKIPLKADSADQVHMLIKQIGRAGMRTVRR